MAKAPTLAPGVHRAEKKNDPDWLVDFLGRVSQLFHQMQKGRAAVVNHKHCGKQAADRFQLSNIVRSLCHIRTGSLTFVLELSDVGNDSSM